MNKTFPLIRILSRRNVISHCGQYWRNTPSNGNQLRFMSTIHNTPVNKAITSTDVSNEITKDFMAVFPDIVRDLTVTGCNVDIPQINEWLSKLLQYNVPDSKMTHALNTILSFKMLSPESEQTDENFKLCYILGWCIEIFQSHRVILDDLIANSFTRRGRPCWHRQNDIGLIAINDAILLEETIYQVFHNHFKNKMYYVDILELYHDVTLKIGFGECLDMLTTQSLKTNKFEKYTLDNYSSIVACKTSYHTYILPVFLVMRMTNINDPEIFKQAENILLKIGHFHQVQDDFLDCYGDPNIMDKNFTDIENGKCSWLIVMALQRANSHQKKIIEDNYGINDPEKVKMIKNIYDELKIPTVFQHYKEETYNLISTHIQQLSPSLPQKLFFKFLENITKRMV